MSNKGLKYKPRVYLLFTQNPQDRIDVLGAKFEI